MMQPKKSGTKKLTKKQLERVQMAQQLRKDFMNLPEEQKMLMQDFFNLHSAAIHFYDLLSEDAKAICDAYVNASQKVTNL